MKKARLKISQALQFFGAPKGIRTPAAGLKGRCPNR